MNELREELTGTSFSTLLNDVRGLFANSGEDSAEAWAKGFDKIMDTYMMQRFSREYLEEAMQGFYSLMDEYATSGKGIDQSEKDALAKEWNNIKNEGQKRVDAMKEILGISAESEISNSSGLAGRISKSITERSSVQLKPSKYKIKICHR